MSEVWECVGLWKANWACPRNHQVLQAPPLWGFPSGSLARAALASLDTAALSCLCFGGGRLHEPLSCQPGARMHGETFVNSECDKNCCTCPKVGEPITCKPRIKPFKNDLSFPMSVHHRLEGHRFEGAGRYPLPQPPSCPVLLAAKLGIVGLRGLTGREPPALCLRTLSEPALPSLLVSIQGASLVQVVWWAESILQAWVSPTPPPGSPL